jgi:multidrug efflux system membrane fusion protein
MTQPSTPQNEMPKRATSSPSPTSPAVRTRNGIRPLFIGLLLLLIVGGGIYWLLSHRKPPATPAPQVPVHAGHPIEHDFPIRINAVGTVTPLNSVNIKVRVDGELTHVAFNEGQDVQKGQLLAELDRGPLDAALQQSIATQQKDQASLDNAKRDVARYQELAKIGAATTQVLDTAQAQVKTFAATVAADAAIVRNAQLQLGFTRLTAPFTGRVGARQADVGSIVHASDPTGLVTLTQMSPITVSFSVSQDVLPSVLAQQKQGDLHVMATNHADNTTLADGKLVFIDNSVDINTGQIKMKALFANADRMLWPGELVNAQTLVSVEKHQLAIPARAVVNGANGTQVFVVGADNKVALKTIQTGVTVDGMTLVRQGLSSADMVVFDGQSRLNPGSVIAVQAMAASAAAASTPSANDIASE